MLLSTHTHAPLKKSRKVVLKATGAWGSVAFPMSPALATRATPRNSRNTVDSTLVNRRELMLRRRASGREIACAQWGVENTAAGGGNLKRLQLFGGSSAKGMRAQGYQRREEQQEGWP